MICRLRLPAEHKVSAIYCTFDSSFPKGSCFLQGTGYKIYYMKDASVKRMSAECTGYIQSIRDTIEILNGKWKVAIIASLGLGPRRFSTFQKEIGGIGTKMLSKELHDLELNELIVRTVYDSKPVTIEYSISEYGKTLLPIIKEMSVWGMNHRRRIMKKK